MLPLILPRLWRVALALLALAGTAIAASAAPERLLYVAVPGIRNYLEFGGHGVLVFDIDQGYRCLRRLPGIGLGKDGKPLNVKGICASAATGRLYVSSLESLACLDLATERWLWEKRYEGGCDRMAITPDGRVLFVPSLEKSHWNVVDGTTGEVLGRLDGHRAAHNTIVGLDGRRAYLADRFSPVLTVVDAGERREIARVGPFADSIRPFTIDGRQQRVYVCVDNLLGFEVGDLGTGRKVWRVEVQGFAKGPVKRHACPSHGVGLTPDEREVWVTDGANERLHVFDNTVAPPKQVASIHLREQPGWVTFRLDGAHAWPSTGEVIEVGSRRIVATLSDETGAAVHSEKMVEVHRDGGRVIRVGDQFGIGRAR